MRVGQSGLPKDLLDLLEVLQDSLEEEWFGFVSDEIDYVIEQPIGERAQLLALRTIVRNLGPATPILADSTCDEIDRVDEAIEMHLRTIFDA
jgi:hypothetical protein